MKLQEEGVEVSLVQESAKALRVVRAETNFVPGTDFPEGLLEQRRREAAGGWEGSGRPPAQWGGAAPTLCSRSSCSDRWADSSCHRAIVCFNWHLCKA